MPALSDVRFEELRTQLFIGATSDMLLSWLQANGAVTAKAIPDAWKEMLASQLTAIPTGHRNDDWFQLLGELGFTGNMNDRELDFWLGGATLPGGVPIVITLFSLLNQASIIPEIALGSSVATFTRASGATYTDFEGLVVEVLDGEPRFSGARRVENLTTFSEAFDNVQWVKQANLTLTFDGAKGGFKYNLSANTGRAMENIATIPGFGVSQSFNILVTVDIEAIVDTTVSLGITTNVGGDIDSETIAITVAAGRQRISSALTYNSGTSGLGVQIFDISGGIGDRFFIYTVQMEDATGQANQNPSEYVSTDVLSAPFHGSVKDGIKSFITLNGNTVLANVVTESPGAPISESDFNADAGGPFGYLSESALTNLILRSEELDDIEWTKVLAVITADDTTAPDGVSTADKLNDDASTGTGQVSAQNRQISLTTDTHCFSVYVKADQLAWCAITPDNFGPVNPFVFFDLTNGVVGSTGGTEDDSGIEALGNGWFRCFVVITVTNILGDFNIFVADSDGGSVVDLDGTSSIFVWGAQVEAGTFPTSYIQTVAATVTRAADVLTYDDVGNIEDAAGSAEAEASTLWLDFGSGAPAVIQREGTGVFLFHNTPTGANSIKTFEGTNISESPLGVSMEGSPQAVAVTWGDALTAFFNDAPDATPAAYDGTFGLNDIGIGCSNVNLAQWNGTVRKVIITDTEALVVPSISPEVQAVFDRMSALSQTEKDAIERFVDTMVAAGYYTDITEIYAPCLNATDFKTGFKFMSLISSAAPPVHTPGQFVDFTTNAQHFLDSANFDSFATLEGFVGAYIVFTGADTTGNSDMFGVADVGGRECYYRWRGTDTNDFNAIFNVTLATPRSASNQRPTGDVVGFGLEGVEVFELQPGGIVVKSTRVTEGVPTTHPFQWHGQNLSGTPAAGNMSNSRYSFMMHSNVLLSNIVQGSLRAAILQFLRDIGVTGVPITAATFLTTEGGDKILTEAGDFLIT